MSDVYEKIEHISYGTNIKNSLKNLVFGFILILIAFIVLWFNEGHYVNQISKMNYISKNAIPVSSKLIDKSNNNKLIATSAQAFSDETLSDGIVTITKALVLSRQVEMYQWKEEQKTKQQDKIGGETVRNTTYSYSKVWSGYKINSDNFENKNYKNPDFPMESARINAQTGHLGAFKLSNKQSESINKLTNLPNLPFNTRYSINGNAYYSGNINNPNIGDIKILYTYAPSGSKISVIGKQQENGTIDEMYTDKGTIYLQYDGLLTKNEMIKKFEQHNKFLTNIFRFVGFILMLIGLSILFEPLTMVLKIFPPLANFVSLLTGLMRLVIAFIFTLLTISIAWLFYRPIISISLILLCIVIFILIKKITPKININQETK